MAAQISTNAEFIQANTTTNAGFILLPTANNIPGRILTIKDTAGTFNLRPLTLSTSGTDRFEEGVNIKRLVEQFGYITLASDGGSRWYTIDGTSMNTYTISTLSNPISMSTQTIRTSTITASTFGFVDRNFNSVSSFYARSTLLFLGSNIIGGSKCGPTQFIPIRRPFVPNQLTGLNLWFDAADPNTFSFTTGNVLTSIRDKSGSGSTVLSFDGSSVVYEPFGFFGTPSFLMTNGHFRGSLSSAVPLTKYTNTTFIVTQLISPAGAGFACMSIGERATGSLISASEVWYRNLDCTTTPSQEFRQVGFFQTNTPVTLANSSVGRVLIVNTNYSGAANGNTLFMRLNGSTTGVTTANATTAPATNGLFFFIGSDANDVSYATNMWNGRISEIIMYNVQLTATQQQQVEGYLAWKWNLVSYLPASHAYKNAPP